MKLNYIFLILIVSVSVGTVSLSYFVLTTAVSLNELKEQTSKLSDAILENQKASDKLGYSILEFADSQGMFHNSTWILDDEITYYKVDDYYLVHHTDNDEVWKISEDKTLRNLPSCLIDKSCFIRDDGMIWMEVN